VWLLLFCEYRATFRALLAIRPTPGEEGGSMRSCGYASRRNLWVEKNEVGSGFTNEVGRHTREYHGRLYPAERWTLVGTPRVADCPWPNACMI